MMRQFLALGLAVTMMIFVGCAGLSSMTISSSDSDSDGQAPVFDNAPQPVSNEAITESVASSTSESESVPSSAAAGEQAVTPAESDDSAASGQALAQVTQTALADEDRFMSSDTATRDWSLAYGSFYNAYETLQPYTMTGLDDTLALRGQLAYTIWTLSPTVIAGDIYDNIAEGASSVQVIDKFRQKSQNLLGALLSNAETGDYFGESRVWLNSRPALNGEKFAEILSTNHFEVGDYDGRTSMTVTAGVEAQLLAQGFAYKTTEAFALEIDRYAYGVCFIDRTYGQVAFWLGGMLSSKSCANMQSGVVYPFDLIVQDIQDRIDEINPKISAEVSDPITGKPVIYLYPEQPANVTVTLGYPADYLTYTYPAYNGGWHVRADPDGTLTNLSDGTQHDYLFWEGNKKVDWDLSKGFVVKGSETEAFLREKLAFMGLTTREYNDFITYWVPEMSQNPYNLISFSTEQYEALAPLDISPAPDSILRVHMVYKGLQQPVNVLPQVLVPWERTDFSAVEWGGSRA